MNEQTDNHTENLRSRVFRIERLTTMPQVVWQLMEALGDEETTPEKLTGLIERDAALAAKVLSLANAAYYGQSRDVTSISRAVVVIGFQELELLTLGAGLAETFDLRNAPSEFDGDGLWLHGLAVGWTARRLAEACGADPGEAMMAGLLHDVGKLVLATHLTDEFARIMERIAAGVPYYRAEQEVGVEHSQVGYMLARKWGLPRVLADCLRFHHDLASADGAQPAAALVALADQIVKETGVGLVHDSAMVDRAAALKAAGVPAESFEALRDEASGRLPELAEGWRGMLAGG